MTRIMKELQTLANSNLLDIWHDMPFYESLVNTTSNYPPENVVANEDYSKFQIQLALAGFERDEIEVTAHEKKLAIESKVQPSNKIDPEYPNTIVNKIAKRAFKLEYSLPASNAEITGCKMDNGLLTIDIEYLTKTEDSCQKIPID